MKRELPADLEAALAAVPGTTSQRECRLLFYLAATAPGGGQIVEIGAFKGKSTAWLAEAARRAARNVITIEPFLRSTEEDVRSVLQRFNLEGVVTLHKALSHEVGKDWSGPIAMLWVDGGHDYEVVRRDVEDFAPHLVSGGVAVFDDMKPRFPGVARALEETLMRDERFSYLGELRGLAIFRRR